MPSGQLCKWCREAGHNIRTCAVYRQEVAQLDVQVTGQARRAADLLRRSFEVKNEEIRELQRKIQSSEKQNAALRRKLAAADVTMEAHEAIIAAQFDEIERRDGVIKHSLNQLGSVFS